MPKFYIDGTTYINLGVPKNYLVMSMDQEIRALAELHDNQCARIRSIQGGRGFYGKLQTMGIKEGQTIKVISKQPFRGPLTIQVCGCQMTLGRGMAQRILVEVIS